MHGGEDASASAKVPAAAHQPVEELFESFNGLLFFWGLSKDPLQWAKPTGASPKTRGSVEERGSSTGC
jgi:hypothetical protein